MQDIKWVGTRDFYIDVQNFFECSNVTYDDGYGGVEVAEDLIVVGDDWYLERASYDGAEWWEFKKIPTLPERHETVRTLIRDEESEELMYTDSDFTCGNSLKYMIAND